MYYVLSLAWPLELIQQLTLILILSPTLPSQALLFSAVIAESTPHHPKPNFKPNPNSNPNPNLKVYPDQASWEVRGQGHALGVWGMCQGYAICARGMGPKRQPQPWS